MPGNKQYLSYPFLYEDKKIVDFELLTDEIASYLALAVSFTKDKEFKEELIKITELVYHLNPCVRKNTKLEGFELAWLFNKYEKYTYLTKDRESLFVLPYGTKLASVLHILRTKSKNLVRLLHHINVEGTIIDDSLFDFSNVLANYFFVAAMYANKLDGVEEIPFASRVYK
ncbi:Cob(I)yrinic acid a,c-diamide adenosyltransferase [Candidatus Izimaplasma bacterium HR1]|jgi:ATP:cob(I)alamin adenosyltransferase|uniref:hypothetical protein n=1 Tax=Candidatus Izimoplasma sp. HR1 TaxID=1541959 RepID=UPI0004F7C81A|nr:Cob(I)yrinic acid a,c-diamide adenosyltransferase [Candidatus Izimaplasma bacterium HR1]